MCVLLMIMQYRVITAYIYIHTHACGINTGKWCNSSATTPPLILTAMVHVQCMCILLHTCTWTKVLQFALAINQVQHLNTITFHNMFITGSMHVVTIPTCRCMPSSVITTTNQMVSSIQYKELRLVTIGRVTPQLQATVYIMLRFVFTIMSHTPALIPTAKAS